MSEVTAISWTKRTWNPWRGCDKVSPGCAHCYMFTAQSKYGRDPSIVVRTKTWADPLKWNRLAQASGKRENVFTCSWSDFFHSAADAWRPEVWEIIRTCNWLNFQILTKRIERVRERLPSDWGERGYPNVWLGVSVENKRFLWRVDQLREIPARVHFVSGEPLLEDISEELDLTGVEWFIVGGESGTGFRPMPHDWARRIRDKCQAHIPRVAFFFKQSAASRTEMGTTLDGRIWREYPENPENGIDWP